MSVEVKPCPFCGNENIKIECKSNRIYIWSVSVGSSYGPTYRKTYSCRCTKCNGRGPTAGGKTIDKAFWVGSIPDWATTEEILEEKAISLWNNRGM